MWRERWRAMNAIWRQGHFLLESGHHGDRWFDLDTLFVRPRAMRQTAAELGRQLHLHRPTTICGPLTGGAFLAQLVAQATNAAFVYTERVTSRADSGLFTARYSLPTGQRTAVCGERVAIVDDIVNAGSAIRATAEELTAHGANVVAFGALLVLGDAGSAYAAAHGLPLIALDRQPSNLWLPADCPLCAAGVPLETPGVFVQ